MVYKVTKVIKNTHTDDFVGLCKKHFVMETLVSILVILLFAAFSLLSSHFESIWFGLGAKSGPLMEAARLVLTSCWGISIVLAALCFVTIFGNFSMKGSLWERFSCKTMEDWLAFAEKHTIMRKYKEMFKCRLCGECFTSRAEAVGEEEAYAGTMDLVIGERPELSDGPNLFEIHLCGGAYTGSYGLGDFQGFCRQDPDN